MAAKAQNKAIKEAGDTKTFVKRKWIINSGSSHNITLSKVNFINYTVLSRILPIATANGYQITAIGTGTAFFETEIANGSVTSTTVTDVLHVLELSISLSMSQNAHRAPVWLSKTMIVTFAKRSELSSCRMRNTKVNTRSNNCGLSPCSQSMHLNTTRKPSNCCITASDTSTSTTFNASLVWQTVWTSPLRSKIHMFANPAWRDKLASPSQQPLRPVTELP